MPQHNPPHPLGFYIVRGAGARAWPSIKQRVREAYWCLTGEWSLHRAYQRGLDDGTRHEFTRIMINGGGLGDLPREVLQRLLDTEPIIPDHAPWKPT